TGGRPLSTPPGPAVARQAGRPRAAGRRRRRRASRARPRTLRTNREAAGSRCRDHPSPPSHHPAYRSRASSSIDSVAVLSPGELVLSASAGDQSAWDALVDRFAGLVWSITRSYRLGAADAADVSQTCWLRLVEHLSRLSDPE